MWIININKYKQYKTTEMVQQTFNTREKEYFNSRDLFAYQELSGKIRYAKTHKLNSRTYLGQYPANMIKAYNVTKSLSDDLDRLLTLAEDETVRRESIIERLKFNMEQFVKFNFEITYEDGKYIAKSKSGDDIDVKLVIARISEGNSIDKDFLNCY